jgi:chromosome segregation ATPase
MPPTTETDLKELKDLVVGLREEIRVGFAQMDTKLAETKAELKGEIQRVEAKMDTKFAQIDTKFSETKAELKGEIQRVEGKVDVIDERAKIGFWGFVGRAIIVSLLGFLILMAVKYALTGTIKLA